MSSSRDIDDMEDIVDDGILNTRSGRHIAKKLAIAGFGRINGAALRELSQLADDMEEAMWGGPEFIGKTGRRGNASERIRQIIGSMA